MPNPLYHSFFERHRDSDALLMIREDGSRLSYREFLDIAARFAKLLVACGMNLGIKWYFRFQNHRSLGRLCCLCPEWIRDGSLEHRLHG